MTTRGMLVGLNAQALERIVQNDSTAVAFNSTTLAARGSFLRLSVETGAARFRSDGTDPTPTTGVLLPSSVAYEIEGFNGTSKFKFIHNTGVAATVLNVERYDATGEGVGDT